jgi:hypothetical protein
MKASSESGLCATVIFTGKFYFNGTNDE